jgi:hypothetical protein
VPGGPPEHPQQRLERWFVVYADEINILQKVRNQLVHSARGGVTDVDLRGADYLARVILATLFEVSPSEVSDDWAMSKLSDFSQAIGQA